MIKKCPQRKNCGHQTYLLVFDCGFATQNAVEERGIKLRLSLIGVKAVLFLLHVGQLRVAKTEHFTVIKQCVCKALKAREEFFFGLRTGAVAPTALVLTSLNAAVFADERRFALVGLAVRVVVKQCSLGH